MSAESVGSPFAGERQAVLVPIAKRVRVVMNGRTVTDTQRALLLLERRKRPAYYFLREDVQVDRLDPGSRKHHSPTLGEASFWSPSVGGRQLENALWSHEAPDRGVAEIQGLLAFDPAQVEHWYEEDEEVFGHPRDPYHRIDIRASARPIRVVFAGETIAMTERGLFLFETGLPTRFYVPPQDVRVDFLQPSATRTTCPYKGDASYWSLRVGNETVADAAWCYQDPLPECPRIKGHLAFYPDKVRIEIDGAPAGG
jgi:uncharacterized protein (DUF427 family)